MVKSSKFITTKAIVLKRLDYGEADKIIQLITPQGRVGAIAKGARREKSKLAGGIQLFAVNDITLLQGKGDLLTLTASRLDTNFGQIIKDYDRTYLAHKFIKHVYEDSASFEGDQWFYILNQSLAALNDSKIDIKLIETWFYLRYSELLGYGLSLQYNTAGNKIIPNQNYYYDVSEKGLAVKSNLSPKPSQAITTNHIKLMRILATNPISVAAKISGVENVIDQSLAVARAHAGV